MTVGEIQKKTRFINDPKGKTVEVILPYKVYQELLELKTSLEIYHQKDVQESIQRAQQDIEAGRCKAVKHIHEAFEWLDK